MRLIPYTGHNGEAGEGACLIFADNRKTAKSFAFACLNSWGIVDSWIDVRVSRLKADPHIMEQATSISPHYIESPETCHDCMLRGEPLNAEGMCESCESYHSIEPSEDDA